MSTCPQCGYPADPAVAGDCPKCDTRLRGQILREVLEIDIVHQGETWEVAREKLLDGIHLALLHGHKGLKVIHGHGSTTGRARIATYARGLLAATARDHGGTLAPDKGNPGASILWLNR